MTEPVVSIYPVNQRPCVSFQTSGKEYKIGKFSSLLQKCMQTRALKDSYMIHPPSAISIPYANKYKFI